MSKKSCDLDPVPAQLLVGCLDVLMHVYYKYFLDLSLNTAFVPSSLKEAAFNHSKNLALIIKISKTFALFQI